MSLGARIGVSLRLTAFCLSPIALMLLYGRAGESEAADRWLQAIEPWLALIATLFLSAWAWRHDRRRLDDDRLLRLAAKRMRPPT